MLARACPNFRPILPIKSVRIILIEDFVLTNFMQWDFLPLLHQGLLHLHHNGAFHSLSEELTAILIGAGNISGGVVGIGGTASGAI